MPRFDHLTTDELCTYMHLVQWNAPLKRWHARVGGAHAFGQGYTPREAMLDAMTLSVGGPPVPFVAVVPEPLVDDPYDNDPMFN